MAMCFSTNMKNLITASDQGIIFIWRLPDGLAKTLSKIKADAIKVRKEYQRIPSVVQEVEEENLECDTPERAKN
jgi:hypothetical protein